MSVGPLRKLRDGTVEPLFLLIARGVVQLRRMKVREHALRHALRNQLADGGNAHHVGHVNAGAEGAQLHGADKGENAAHPNNQPPFHIDFVAQETANSRPFAKLAGGSDALDLLTQRARCAY